MLSVGIISGPRVPVYLRVSLDSYFTHWDIQPHIFLEPDALGDPRGIEHRNPHTLGCAFNWFESLRWMYNHTDTPYIMMCEDDILWRSTASERIRTLLSAGHVDTQEGRLKLSDVAMISPYLSERNQYEYGPRNQWVVPKVRASWCGALCLILPRETVRYFIDNAQEFMWYTCHRTHNKRVLHLDYAIGSMVVKEMHKYIVAYNPTLILHLGEVSTFAQSNEPGAKDSVSRLPAL